MALHLRESQMKIVYSLIIVMSLSLGLLKISKFRRTEEVCSQKPPVQDLGETQACLAVIKGDVGLASREDLKSVLTKKKSRFEGVLSESFYLNQTKNCSAFISDRRYVTATLSEEERDFPIAYSMVIHEKIEMFERLLRALYAPQNVYCVHVDKKAPEPFKKAVEAIASCFPNVFLAAKQETIVYASWSRVQADLNCMGELLDSPVKWRYILNTCGADFPIKTNAEIVQALKLLNGKNSLESEETPKHKKVRWERHYEVKGSGIIQTNERKTRPPISTPMFSGNAYFVLRREFVEQLYKNPEAKALLEWEKDTYSPDEHLWATLQRMPTMPGSNPPNHKYHTSDMISIARLVKWSYLEGDIRKGAPYPPCQGRHRHSVCVYGLGDLTWMVQQRHFLANKFDAEVDDVALTCLEHYLRNKTIGWTSDQAC
ncbi:beta-1,3-galactosyl-O-glycosyl-glycoprotein beta-1,6-N-acetylglucosaminyltransferase 3-like [Engraulis encrasicolus]|uniref:beta-1,3-galactosyl-O-glycosyl-glycoprotein beta-1,6-N-acetylglucosaminyltransferase 3-like n=1 Tax=Engraulis encrasicolus TaxID=184585 RepID=UPI002FD3EBAA